MTHRCRARMASSGATRLSSERIVRLSSDRSGNFATLAALLAVPLLLAASLTVNLGDAYRVSEGTQHALDAATMAGLTEYASSGDSDAAKSTAIDVFDVNFRNNTGQTLDKDAIGEDLTLALDASGGTYTATGRFAFEYTPVFLPHRPFGIVRVSQASEAAGDEACVLALSKNASRAFEAGGNTTVDMSGCVVVSDSGAGDSIYVGGSASLEAECLQAAGGINADSSKTTLQCAAARANAAPVGDPFASIQMPSAAKSEKSAVKANGKGTLQLDPGTYKGGMDIKSSVNLQPGDYIIDGGTLTLNAKASLSGSKVTFFLLNGASVKINGGASLSLSPPTDGPWAGFSFVAARDNTSDATFNGGSDTHLSGIIYMPSASKVTYAGNGSTGSGDCVRLVAQTIKLIGDSKFKSDCKLQLSDNAVTTATAPYFAK